MCSPLNRQLSTFLICFDFSEWIWPHMESLWPIRLYSALRLHLFHRGQCLQDATTCNINRGAGEPARGSFWRETLLHGGCGHCPLLWPLCPPATRSSKGKAGSHLCRSYRRSQGWNLAGEGCCCRKPSQLEALQRGQGVDTPIKKFKAEEGKHVPAFSINTRSSTQPCWSFFVSFVKLAEVFHMAEQNNRVV